MTFYLENRNIEYNCAKHIPPTACESALNSTGLSAGAAAYETAICYAQLGCATRASTLPLYLYCSYPLIFLSGTGS